MHKTKKKGKIISVLAEKIYLARKNLIKIIFFYDNYDQFSNCIHRKRLALPTVRP